MDISQPEIIIVALITAFFSIITGVSTWLFGRRKSDAEIAEISSRVYSGLVEDLESRICRQDEIIQAQGTTIQGQDAKIRSIRVYVEQLERLLLSHGIVNLYDLEEIQEGIGL
jgi:hypothetical protein